MMACSWNIKKQFTCCVGGVNCFFLFLIWGARVLFCGDYFEDFGGAGEGDFGGAGGYFLFEKWCGDVLTCHFVAFGVELVYGDAVTCEACKEGVGFNSGGNLEGECAGAAE